ncbi:MAG: hypothetical protein IH965_06255 [Gemmatimonadetes bacterium]|nr:hypothetical protein [Gemmatimonadota bacterium]
MDVALATSAALPGLSSDDRLLLLALLDAGVKAVPAVWEDPHCDWSAARACVVRSVWDYAYRRDAFLAWARRVARSTALWNSATVIEWNTHKRYLTELAAQGVPVVPTVQLPAGTAVRLEAVLADRGWERAVLKAAVAQTGRYLKSVEAGACADGQRHLDRLLPHEDMLVQPYLPSIETSGEISLVFIDGELSHAVRKRAATGDFRVHDDFGGTVHLEQPCEAEVTVAHRALGTVDEPLLYARVDLVRDETGAPVVMELELVEPDLFFRCVPESAERLAAAVVRRLG